MNFPCRGRSSFDCHTPRTAKFPNTLASRPPRQNPSRKQQSSSTRPWWSARTHYTLRRESSTRKARECETKTFPIGRLNYVRLILDGKVSPSYYWPRADERTWFHLISSADCVWDCVVSRVGDGKSFPLRPANQDSGDHLDRGEFVCAFLCGCFYIEGQNRRWNDLVQFEVVIDTPFESLI